MSDRNLPPGHCVIVISSNIITKCHLIFFFSFFRLFNFFWDSCFDKDHTAVGGKLHRKLLQLFHSVSCSEQNTTNYWHFRSAWPPSGHSSYKHLILHATGNGNLMWNQTGVKTKSIKMPLYASRATLSMSFWEQERHFLLVYSMSL